MSRKVSRKGIVAIIIYLIAFISVICGIFYYIPDRQAAIPVALFVFSGVGIWLFTPIREDLENFVKNLFIKKSIYRICTFGRAGSGKTTFITTAFTFCDTAKPIISTENFDYYNYKVPLELRNYMDVEIADYRGQKPGQIINHADPGFFGAEGSRVLNAIVFIVDLIPRKNDEHGNPLNDEALFNWLIDGDIIDKIKERVYEQESYIGDAILEILIDSLHSKNLKSVILVINKLDLIDKLIDNGHLDISNFNDSKKYAEHHFKRMINNISRACGENNIKFSIFTICGKKTDDTKPVINCLLRGGN
ncbi:hypothetical protein [Argonema antarcticum]|uniref:hypothetical protein n=1 Tax=Argonema antarcticum TaxID=2942763 RepID=UPI002012F2ED|nr:hypothetical protein [Argonema antarcticum]MCL1473584.1 hypothetical protein [Argonema antarcticum A004/B2]